MPDSLPVEGDRDGEFVFEEKGARRATEFFPRYLVHVEGRWAGLPFELQPWQYAIIWNVFGWKRPDGSRRYRRVYVEVGRKNGKSSLAAGIALLMLLADSENGPQIYGAAENREQASIIYRIAAQMVMRNPEFLKLCDVVPSTRTVAVRTRSGFYRAIPADAPSAHGINAHGVIVDELHTQPNSDLVDVLTTSQGAREQPLTFFFTTAGYDARSFCGQEHARADKLLRGVISDPYTYVVIYAAGEKDDIMSEETWRKANPSMDHFGPSFIQFLREEAQRAHDVPAFENVFRRLHLNQWTKQSVRWMPMDAWDRTAGYSVDEKTLEGRPCYGGLDLAQTTDLAALALDFVDDAGAHQMVMRYWLPEETVDKRSRSASVPYEQWAADGLIKLTEGSAIDFGIIREDVLALAKRFDIREIAYDRWGATQLAQELTGEGLTMIAHGQGFRDMSYPTKEFLGLVLNRKLQHGGHPILRWNADNLVVKQDPAANLKPDKEKSTEKIDGAVAAIMAIGRALLHDSAAPNVYVISA